MNATSPGELWSGAAPTEATDDRLEQIRDLLYGEFKREHEARLRALETRVKELEGDLRHTTSFPAAFSSSAIASAASPIMSEAAVEIAQSGATRPRDE